MQGLAPVRKQMASFTEPTLLRVPRPRSGHAPLQQGPRLRVRALHATDEEVKKNSFKSLSALQISKIIFLL